jgi:hypothetical protein
MNNRGGRGSCNQIVVAHAGNETLLHGAAEDEIGPPIQKVDACLGIMASIPVGHSINHR